MSEETRERTISVAKESLGDDNPDAIVFDGLDDAIVGIGQQWGGPRVAAYSAEKIVVCLRGQGMNEEEAHEWYGHNIMCLAVGVGTPFIFDEIREEQ